MQVMTSLPGPNFCAACQQPIHDQFLLHVLDQTWHSHCLLCADCKEPQNESCFYRDDMILCRRDFIRRYGARCAGCNMVIEREEMVRKARNQIFHCRCFCCSVCQRTLDTGERLYVIDGKKFVCKNDYNPSKILGNAMTNRSSNDECSSDEEVDEHSDDHGDTATVSNESNSGAEENSSKGDENHLSQKRRGPRTTIKAKQLETLKAAFASTPKPTRHIREQLAAETGLNMRVIQVWFQNRRSKERRMKQMRINGNYRGNRRQRQNTSREEDESNQSMGEFMPLEPSPRFQTIQFASNPPQTSTIPLISQAPSNPPSLSTYELYGSTANSVDEMPLDFLGNPLESSTIPFWAAPSIDDFNKLTANV